MKVSLSKCLKDMSDISSKTVTINKENPAASNSATKLQSSKSLLKTQKIKGPGEIMLKSP